MDNDNQTTPESPVSTGVMGLSGDDTLTTPETVVAADLGDGP
jgi:hypothetical protein